MTHISVLALCEGTGSDDESQNESEPDDFNPQSPEPPRPESPDSAASNGKLLSSYCVHILNKMRETLQAMYVVLTLWLCLIVFHLLLVDISWCLAEGSVQRSCAAPPGPDGMPIFSSC